MIAELRGALLGGGPVEVDEPLLRRVVGIVFAAGGCLGGFSLLLPNPPSSDETALALIAGTAFAIGLLTLLVPRPIPHWLVHVAIAAGSVLISLGIHFSGAAGVYPMMFVWIAVFTAVFFPRRVVAAHLCWLLFCYAVALVSITDPAGYSPVTRVLVTGFALLVASGITGWLVERRREAEERSDRFFRLSRDMLCTVTTDGRFKELNSAWTETLGYPEEELRSHSYLHFVHPADRKRTREAAAGLFEGRQMEAFENRYRAKDGSWHWLLWSAALSRETNQIFGRATDITAARDSVTERERLMKELESMARTDPLTGIPNRRWMNDNLEREMGRALRSGWSLALAMVDLDHFKDYNDRHGHIAGDELLQQAVQCWRAELRSSDFLARFGGEEFVILLPDTTAADAERLVNRIRSATPRDETCSAGIAVWDGREDRDAFIDRADDAMYEAKRAGRDRSVVAGAVVESKAERGAG